LSLTLHAGIALPMAQATSDGTRAAQSADCAMRRANSTSARRP
jgi:hypothetical protein